MNGFVGHSGSLRLEMEGMWYLAIQETGQTILHSQGLRSQRTCKCHSPQSKCSRNVRDRVGMRELEGVLAWVQYRHARKRKKPWFLISACISLQRNPYYYKAYHLHSSKGAKCSRRARASVLQPESKNDK